MTRSACARLFVYAAPAMLALVSAAAGAADADAQKQQSLANLRAAIVKNLTTPCGVKPKQRVELKVLLQDNGFVQSVALVQTSGAPVFDAALMTAISSAQPFKLPQDPAARKDLQNLNLKFDAYSTPIPPCK